jgi:hypothetical protein
MDINGKIKFRKGNKCIPEQILIYRSGGKG